MENERPGHTHFLSEEQITALTLVERSGLMGETSIVSAFDVTPARLAKWREIFRDWFPFHRPSVHRLQAELAALRHLERENQNLKSVLKAHGIEIPQGDDHGNQ